jgi:tRNA modification GTPase
MVFPSHAGDALTISCHRQMGIDELRRRLVRYTDQHISELDRESVFITHARHQHALKEAIQYMQNFNEQRQHHVYEEILADTLQRACGALEEMVGKIHTDDVLGNLFSTFCIGK